MARNPEQIRKSLDHYLGPDFRGRLRARGIARGMASSEKALAFLLRRDLLDLRSLIVGWLANADHSDDVVARRIQDEKDVFGPEDAVVLALTTTYFRALGLADTALLTGDRRRYESA